MKTRDLMATMWLGLVIVTVTLGLVSAGVLFDNRQLRQEGRDLRREMDVLATETTGLKAERGLIDEELRAQQKRVEELSAQVAELKLRPESPETPAGLPAYRIRAYLENQMLSQGWLLPGRATTNAGGELVYEPVVVLDPLARTALTAAMPSAPAPAQPASVTVNHNYPNSYGTVWPAIWVSSGAKKHQRPAQPPADSPRFTPPPQPQPQPVSPFLSTRVWQPQVGWQQMGRGRPGGEWISSAPRGQSYISGGGGGIPGAGGTGTFPARY